MFRVLESKVCLCVSEITFSISVSVLSKSLRVYFIFVFCGRISPLTYTEIELLFFMDIGCLGGSFSLLSFKGYPSERLLNP